DVFEHVIASAGPRRARLCRPVRESRPATTGTAPGGWLLFGKAKPRRWRLNCRRRDGRRSNRGWQSSALRRRRLATRDGQKICVQAHGAVRLLQEFLVPRLVLGISADFDHVRTGSDARGVKVGGGLSAVFVDDQGLAIEPN